MQISLRTSFKVLSLSPKLSHLRSSNSSRPIHRSITMTSSGSLLKDKFAIVTGGGRGIGSEIALSFAREGATIALVARTETQLQQVAEECKKAGAGDVSTHSADLTDYDVRERLIADLLKAHGGVDILVNNAGMGCMPGDPLNLDMRQVEKMLLLNTHAPIHLTHLVSKPMAEKKRGIIVNMCSVAGIEPMTSACAYAASKWGLRGWSLSCYQSLRKHGIKVVTVNPGMVRTPMTDGMTSDPAALERMIAPEDIAEAVMLAVRTKQSATPVEITIRPTEPVM